ncbi:MAG: ATP-dependent DNA helicase PcrA, partial [Deltaproteobacteria bacterium]
MSTLDLFAPRPSSRDLLDGLNPPQREAASRIEGPLLILAGAGSGKTRVLTHRIAHMLDQGIDPRHILAVTFTNKAAGEMKERVHNLVGERGRRILVTTFHSACVRFLRQDIEVLGYPRSFTIYDTDDQNRLLKRLLAAEGIRSKEWTPARLRGVIDRAKNRMQTPRELAEELRHSPGDPSARLYARYQEELQAAGAVDFNDLLNLVVRLWREHPAVLARYQRRFRYVMVDEYQDTNRAQYELIRLLMARPPGEPRNIAVVGDDDQSIYAFRGANIRNILDFERDFPDATVVRLEQNYRSMGNILAAAHAVVRHNAGRMDKKLWTDRGDGEPVVVRAYDDPNAEAEAIVAEIRRQVEAGARRYGDTAIIYRTNAQSRSFEQVMVRSGVPHVLVGARKFYERREVRDLLAYLKLVLNPADDMALLRVINVPRRGIGAKSLESLRQYAAREGVPLLAAARTWSRGKGRAQAGAARFVEQIDHFTELARTLEPGRLVERIAAETGYIDALRSEDSEEARGRIDNIAALASAVDEPVDAAALFDVTAMSGAEGDGAALDLDDPLVRLQLFCDRVSLAGQDEDLPDADDAGQVTLLTAHLAKGLEFPQVYVVGMFEGGFPHFRAMDREEDIEEERRLVYVAMTRARDRLVLTRSRRNLVVGEGYRDVRPSRFLADLPDTGVVFEGGGAGMW